jgi:hypothetical protein
MPDESLVPDAVAVPETEAQPIHWTAATRVVFRFSFCYFMIYALCCGNATIWEVIPFHIGEHLENWFSWPFFHGAQWLGQHLFHLHGLGAKLHDTGSGDTILNWIAVGIMLAIAIVATLLWTAFDRSRTYPTLFAWLRFTLRLTLGVAMLNYGLAKLFPLQMSPPMLAVLNEPLGNTSPMTMLWTLIGLNPIYEMICGAAEVAGGLLILYRRTALFGALLTAFVVSNVVLYNFFFDVPVKIYAAHLLLMSIVVIAPDFKPLFGFFWQHRASAPSGIWVPPTKRRAFRITTIVIEIFFVVMTAIVAPFSYYPGYKHQRDSLRHPSPWVGRWHVDTSTLAGAPHPIITGDGAPMTDMFVEPSGRANVRSSDDELWRAGMNFDDKKHTLDFGSEFTDHPMVFAVSQPDAMHVVLTPTGDGAKTDPVLTLTRIPLPQHYPLLDRGFHFVNEWGLER